MLTTTRRRPKSRHTQIEIPAPVAGLNLVDDVMSIDEKQALRLDNWICRRDGLHTRKGSVLKTTLPDNAPVEHVAVWYGEGRPARVFAFSGDKIFNVSTEVPELSETARRHWYWHEVNYGMMPEQWTRPVSETWQTAFISNDAGSFLVVTNGSGYLKYFDGTAWHTGEIDAENAALFSPCLHMHRQFFAQANSLTLWYLPVHRLHGVAEPLYLEAKCQRGGKIAGIMSMTQDGGRNTNDQLVVVTTGGEMLVYAGTNPDNYETWDCVGVWDIPVPAGMQPLVQIGGAVGIMTVTGLLLAQDVMTPPDSRKASLGLTDKIRGLDWSKTCSIVDSISERFTLVNMTDEQYVRDAETGGWSRFDFSGTRVWFEFGDELLFSGPNGEIRAYGEYTDTIEATVVHGYSGFGTDSNKVFRQARALYRHYGALAGRATDDSRNYMRMLTDYDKLPRIDYTLTVNSPFWTWEQISFDMMPELWVKPARQIDRWQDIRSSGFMGALHFTTKCQIETVYRGAKVRLTGGRQI